MRIGIISFAHMHAASYAQSLQEIHDLDIEFTGIYDDDETRGRHYADKYGVHFYGNYQDLLNDIDAVIVTSENAKHHAYVLAAAKAKKHILCEKPLATTLDDAKEMVEVCRENNVFLGTAFPCRFNTTILRAKQIIDEGKLGRILAIRGTNRGTNPGGWFVDPKLSGGGALMDHTVHVTDLMRWFLRSEVKEVYAEKGHFSLESPIDDTGIVTLEFKNGVFATIDCSWSRNKNYPTWGDVTLEIVGTDGTLTVDAFAQKLHVYSDVTGVKWDYWGDDMDLGLIRNFVSSIMQKTPPLVSVIPDGVPPGTGYCLREVFYRHFCGA
jgi:UDP-N-acetylglucosamine 3-dehydrogenase